MAGPLVLCLPSSGLKRPAAEMVVEPRRYFVRVEVCGRADRCGGRRTDRKRSEREGVVSVIAREAIFGADAPASCDGEINAATGSPAKQRLVSAGSQAGCRADRQERS